jgi:hypothetical protein
LLQRDLCLLGPGFGELNTAVCPPSRKRVNAFSLVPLAHPPRDDETIDHRVGSTVRSARCCAEIVGKSGCARLAEQQLGQQRVLRGR